MSKTSFFIAAAGLFLLCIHLAACQKQETEFPETTIEATSNRADHCECVDMGCAGPQFLQVEILEREGLEAFRIELKKICPTSADNLCLYWQNPAPGSVKQTEVGYNIGGARPAGEEGGVQYQLKGFFNTPSGNVAFARVRLIGPGINRVVTFGPEYPQSYVLCPCVPACW